MNFFRFLHLTWQCCVHFGQIDSFTFMTCDAVDRCHVVDLEPVVAVSYEFYHCSYPLTFISTLALGCN
jgi:hypothetical protein